MNPPTTPSELATTSSGTETLYPSNNTTQWGHQETVELIKIRGQLEKNFSSSKRFKALWETVASSLRDKGFFRTPHQCKSKWKNLVNRYKDVRAITKSLDDRSKARSDDDHLSMEDSSNTVKNRSTTRATMARSSQDEAPGQ